jgi:hypothetical protein
LGLLLLDESVVEGYLENRGLECERLRIKFFGLI